MIFLQKEQNRKIEKKEDMVVLSKSKSLEEHFIEVKTNQERNRVIRLAYLNKVMYNYFKRKDHLHKIECGLILKLELLEGKFTR